MAGEGADYKTSVGAVAPIGILAGSGAVPAEVASEIVARGGRVHIVPIDGAADGKPDPRLAAYGAPARTFAWGELGGILASLKAAGCREVVFVGGVSRPDLAKLRPDAGLVWHAPSVLGFVAAGGDDGLIRKGIRFVERQGFEVVGVADVAPGLLVPAGAIGIEEPGTGDMADILLGSAVVRALGRHDIGQAVIVAQGMIEAIEGAEGTDRMLDRVAQKRAANGAGALAKMRSGVLVKRPKPGQEMRIDMPAIGPRTVERADAAGLAGVAVLAGATLAADRAELVHGADRAGLFVYGFTEGVETHNAARDRAPQTAALTFEALDGGQPMTKADRADARRGAAALDSLAALNAIGGRERTGGRDSVGGRGSFVDVGGSGSAVVVNGYIVGIEPTGDVTALIARTRHIRPWGITRWRRQAGVVVVGHPLADRGAGSGAATFAAAAEAKLSAIVLHAVAGTDPARVGPLPVWPPSVGLGWFKGGNGVRTFRSR